MSQLIATVLFAFGILGLFLFDRDRNARPSKALWIPVAWFLITGSRPLSLWLKIAPASSSDPYLEGSPLDRNVLAVLLALGLIVLLRRVQQVVPLLRANGPILLFFFYCAVSVLWSDYPDVAFKRWFKAVGELVMVMVVLTDPHRAVAIKRLLVRTAFLLIPLSLLFIIYYPSLGRGFVGYHADKVSYTGVTTSKNTLGMILLTFGVASVWRFLQELGDREDRYRTRRLIAHGTILAMVFWLYWMVNSKTSLACFLLASGLLVAMRLPSLARKPAIMHCIVIAMLSVVLISVFFDPAGRLVGTLGRESTLTGRTEMWNYLLAMPGDWLVGTGFASFWLGERLQTVQGTFENLNEAHNGYLEVYLNLGWIGVILLAILIVTGYRKAVATSRRDPEAGRLWLAYVLVGVVYSLTEAGFKTLTPIWIFFLMAIMAVSQAPGTEAPLPLEDDQTDSFAEPEPEVNPVLCSGLRQESL